MIVDPARTSSALLDWFASHKRSLPWRSGYSPYAVYISEMMLQQTQMTRGVEYFKRWMERFPTIFDVAAASEEDIFACWEGLGYYGRARSLHKAAGIICGEHKGRIPDSPAVLETLPGVGKYTANAIAAIAYEQAVVAVDTNFVRVLSRLLDLPPAGLKQAVEDAALQMLPKGKSRDFNQAVMEFGALVCVKKPQCLKQDHANASLDLCPMAEFCLAFRNGTVPIRPIQPAAKKMQHVHAAFVIAEDPHGQILLKKRAGQKLWKNLWDLPGFEKPCRYESPFSEDYVAKQLQYLHDKPQYLGTVRYAYTNHKAAADYYRAYIDEAVPLEVFEWSDPECVPMPAHHRKALALFRRRQ